jgi:hypothetical protein
LRSTGGWQKNWVYRDLLLINFGKPYNFEA